MRGFETTGRKKKKKTMDKAWWAKIEKVKLFDLDPEPDDIDWQLLFGNNTEGGFENESLAVGGENQWEMLQREWVPSKSCSAGWWRLLC